jgi:hypothetical protein
MDTLLLKLVVTPILTGGASLAGRKWGQNVAGWLIGLPFNGGPILFFIALEHGRNFAAATSSGAVAGVICEAAFCISYSRATRRFGCARSFLAGTIGFLATAALLQLIRLPAGPIFILAWMSLSLAIWLLPHTTAPVSTLKLPPWDLPGRMILSTLIVLLLTGLAPVLGPGWTGILAAFPITATSLIIFAHTIEGRDAALRVLRGFMFGLYSFSGFFFALSLTIEPLGIAESFLASLALALAIQLLSLRLIRRRPQSA